MTNVTPHDKALAILALPERDQAKALAEVPYPEIIKVKSAIHVLRPKKRRSRISAHGLSAKDEAQTAADILDLPESDQIAALAEKPVHRIPYIKKAMRTERSKRARQALQAPTDEQQ